MKEEDFYSTVSKIFSGPVFPIFVVFMFVLSSENLRGVSLLGGLAIGWTFLSFIPLVTVIYAKKMGWSESFDVPRRKNRTKVFLPVIVSYVIASTIFWYLSSHVLFMISLAYVLVTSSLAVANLFWKVSIHAAGIAGPTTALVYVFGAKFAILYALLIPVCLSRYRLRAHTKKQLVGGIILSVIVTLAVYLSLY